MEDNKWVGKSLTIWGVMVLVFSNVLPLFFDVANPAEYEFIGPEGASIIEKIGGVAGSIMALWGRIRATKLVTMLGGGVSVSVDASVGKSNEDNA